MCLHPQVRHAPTWRSYRTAVCAGSMLCLQELLPRSCGEVGFSRTQNLICHDHEGSAAYRSHLPPSVEQYTYPISMYQNGLRDAAEGCQDGGVQQRPHRYASQPLVPQKRAGSPIRHRDHQHCPLRDECPHTVLSQEKLALPHHKGRFLLGLQCRLNQCQTTH